MTRIFRRWWTHTYHLEPQVKLKHDFKVIVHEGFFTDENEIHVNNLPFAYFEASYSQFNGIIEFELFDKPYEFRFNYSGWTGNPRSLLLLQNNRILARYGDTSAMKSTQPVRFVAI